MQIQRSFQTVEPMMKPPQHDINQLKTPSQKKAVQEANLSNDTVKQIAKQSTNKVYETLRKLVKNTEYDVSYSLGKFGEEKQFRFTLKKDGKEIVSMPPDIAINIAERAKQTTIGLLMDQRV